MLCVGDKVEILNVLGQARQSRRTLFVSASYLKIMEIDENKFVYDHNYPILNKIGIIIRIDVLEEMYFIHFPDGNICAMYEKYENVIYLKKTKKGIEDE